MRLTAKYIPGPAALIAIVIALIILGHWIFIPQSSPIYVEDGGIVKFTTALCMGLSGIALFIYSLPHTTKVAKTIAVTCSVIVTVISILVLVQYLFPVNTGIDQLFIREQNAAKDTAPGRMSWTAALLFLMLSACHFMMPYRKLHLLVQVLLFIAFVFLFLLLLVYAAQPTPVRLLRKPTVAYTVIGFLLLFIGSFFNKHLVYLKFSLQKRIAAFISFAILFLIIVFIVFAQSARLTRSTAKAVEETNHVLEKSQALLEAALNIETGTRGYLLSQNEEFLQPFNRGLDSIYKTLNDLENLSGADTIKKERLDSLRYLVDANIELRQSQIQLIRAGKMEEVQKIFTDGTNKRLMDQLRTLLGSIKSDENRLLAKHKETNETTIVNTYRVIVLFQVATALLLIFAFISIYKNVRSRNKAEQQIRELNEGLEKKVEEKSRALVNSELHFRNILDNLLEGVQIIGFDWKYKYVNDSFLKHAKYTREELEGHTVMEKYPGIENTEVFQAYKKCFEERVPVHLENEFEFPDKSMGWFELSFQPVPEGIFILSMDISERKRSETRLVQANKMLDMRAGELQSSNTELERFAYVASHDLQEPLRMVSSFLHLLERKLGDTLEPAHKQYIDFAVDGAERMKTLIQDLLQYSRVGTSKETITNVDCNEVMETVRNVLSLSIHETGATLNVHPLPVVKAAGAQMLQLFQNLVSNAIKYRGDKAPELEIGCADKGSKWEFFVKDNGIGIDPKFFDKIFIIFQRLHNKSEYSGTGIGLAICKKIVEKHGGQLWVNSEPGKGSTFYFTLPKNPS